MGNANGISGDDRNLSAASKAKVGADGGFEALELGGVDTPGRNRIDFVIRRWGRHLVRGDASGREITGDP